MNYSASLIVSVILFIAVFYGSAHAQTVQNHTLFSSEKTGHLGDIASVRVYLKHLSEQKIIRQAALAMDFHGDPFNGVIAIPMSRLGVLDDAGIVYQVTEKNIQIAFDLWRSEYSQSRFLEKSVSDIDSDFEADDGADVDNTWYTDYKPYDDILERIASLSERDERIKQFSLGASHEDRPIWAVEIGDHNNGRPTIMILGTQHAREWVSPLVVMYLLESIVTGLVSSDERYENFLKYVNFLIVPVVNPDGYVFSWTNERFYRKNRNPDSGVDLNRNWDVSWGTGVDLNQSNLETYPGVMAFSEPETKAVRDAVQARNVIAFFDYHTAASVVLYPYAFTMETSPRETDTRSIAESMAMVISMRHGFAHSAKKPGQRGPAGGLAQDWALQNEGALAWTVELRNDGGFAPNKNTILPTAEENLAGFLHAVDRILDVEQLAAPVVSSSSSSSTTSSSGGRATAGATYFLYVYLFFAAVFFIRH